MTKTSKYLIYLLMLICLLFVSCFGPINPTPTTTYHYNYSSTTTTSNSPSTTTTSYYNSTTTTTITESRSYSILTIIVVNNSDTIRLVEYELVPASTHIPSRSTATIAPNSSYTFTTNTPFRATYWDYLCTIYDLSNSSRRTLAAWKWVQNMSSYHWDWYDDTEYVFVL